MDKEGKILGTHKGIACYTIGQRRGLGLPLGTHVYVTEIRPDRNEVVIGSNEDVFRDRLNCRCLNFMSEEPLPIGQRKRLNAKIRYKHEGEYCTIERIQDDLLEVIFEKKVRAITKGQSIVFYEGDYVYGGGVIC